MPEPAATARSPIAPAPPEVMVGGWAVSGCRSTAQLVITDCTPLAKVTIKTPATGATATQTGVPFGRACRQTWALDGREVPVLVIGSGPGEWLVLAPSGSQDRVVDRLDTEASSTELVTVVDLTHGRALVRLTGSRSVNVLAKETAVDLSDDLCPHGAALRSSVAGLAADIVRDDLAGTRSYLVHCERSSGQYLFDSLLDAGAEFGIEVDGFVRPGL